MRQRVSPDLFVSKGLFEVEERGGISYVKSWGRSCQVEEVVSTKATRQEELYMVRNRKETSVAGASEECKEAGRN